MLLEANMHNSLICGICSKLCRVTSVVSKLTSRRATASGPKGRMASPCDSCGSSDWRDWPAKWRSRREQRMFLSTGPKANEACEACAQDKLSGSLADITWCLCGVHRLQGLSSTLIWPK